jgi:hexosaminidase
MYQEAGAPLQTIHFGGDEVPEGVWEKSPSVLKLIAKNQAVKNTDDLWYYYFGKVNQMLKSRNLFLSVGKKSG